MNSKIVHNIWCFSLFLIFNLYYRRWYFILQATCIPTLPIAYIGQFACFIPSSPGPEVWNATGHHPPVGNSHGHPCTPYTRLKVTSPGHSSLCITTTPSLKCYGVSYQYSSTPCPYQCELSFLQPMGGKLYPSMLHTELMLGRHIYSFRNSLFLHNRLTFRV